MQWHRFWDVARKAGLAAVVAGGAAVTQAAPGGITADEWVVIVGSIVIAYATVYTVGNKVPAAHAVDTAGPIGPAEQGAPTGK